ncbi:uncharacterized protein [Oryza sativa Japonica Group]|uniref:Os07g0136500 protein n=1 Tax=Oryza sativa subsp. japonica TaxID=39947 RepID=B7F9C0_ORYSJ|nr:uncharacterized protein LOC4342354 [Oryza sativa Japonica Group]KAB8104252.1 hypothetical protein EE612_037006 [Oryza sativa]KAF2921357.1 hypothetical protein DAI22_07g026000 [Oryza sativa Japonica Group]BAH01218.1 unnamed protein product [Oryza sativa Japonica Group]BAS99967.1 Os07g0136500 [Oryza sativa Japonica Group]
MAAMALRSLVRKVMPVPAALRRAPPSSRSLHHLEDKLRGTTSPKTTAPPGNGRGSYFKDNHPTFAELVQRDTDRRSFNRMLVAGAASGYAVALVIMLSLRRSVKEDLRNNIYD